ncbi:MAG: HTTM domain-containing protein [Planctomycetaceae bacterium]|nr:HTTM domain-containing protein [Planctomycetaceae bacterium]
MPTPNLCISAALREVIARADRFFHEPASAAPLAAFRIGVASVLLVQALCLASDVAALYGPKANVRWDVMDPADGPTSIHPFAPRVRMVATLLAPLNIAAELATQATFAGYAFALVALLFGWKTRPAAIVAWLTHLALNNAAAATIYGVDMFAHIALFYCVVLPVGAVLSIDARRKPSEPTSGNRLALRVLQLHLCVVYLSSAIEKGLGVQWWNGEAVWRAVTLPGLSQVDMTWLATAPWIAVLAGWGTLAVEAGYAVLIWPTRTRTAMALATIGMHAGIGVVMGLTSFSALMIALTATAFLVPREP